MATPTVQTPKTYLIGPGSVKTPYSGQPRSTHTFAGFPIRTVGDSQQIKSILERNTCRICKEIMQDPVKISPEHTDILCRTCVPKDQSTPAELTTIPREGMDTTDIHCPFHMDCPEVFPFEKLRNFVSRESRKITPSDITHQELRDRFRVDFDDEPGPNLFPKSAEKNKEDLKQGGHLYTCPWRLKRCQACEEVMPRVTLIEDHKQHCSMLGKTPQSIKSQEPLASKKCDWCSNTYFAAHGVRHLSRCLVERVKEMRDGREFDEEQKKKLSENLALTTQKLSQSLEAAVDSLAQSQIIADHLSTASSTLAGDVSLSAQLIAGSVESIQALSNQVARDNKQLRQYQACDARRILLKHLRSQPELKKIPVDNLTEEENAFLASALKDQSMKTKYRAEALGKLDYSMDDRIIPAEGCAYIWPEHSPNQLLIHVSNTNSLPPSYEAGNKATLKTGEARVAVSVTKTPDGKVQLNFAWRESDHFKTGSFPKGQADVEVFSANPVYCHKLQYNLLAGQVKPDDALDFLSFQPLSVPRKGANGEQIPQELLIKLQFDEPALGSKGKGKSSSKRK